ncbi:hypothetical protein MFUL124B02_33900 [Myxococcus fulvus 124B02]|nr:hypothetical protein MFUL124B02_33900 [Myxococcus fulvus 124B02]
MGTSRNRPSQRVAGWLAASTSQSKGAEASACSSSRYGTRGLAFFWAFTASSTTRR